jgi:hypothetical protein
VDVWFDKNSFFLSILFSFQPTSPGRKAQKEEIRNPKKEIVNAKTKTDATACNHA